MDSNLLLVNIITLLYLESELGQDNGSRDFCKSVLETVKIPETSVEMHSGSEVILSLRMIALWLISQDIAQPVDKAQMLQRIRVATRDNVYLYNAVADAISSEDDQELKSKILAFRKGLREHLNNEEVRGIMSAAYKKANFEPGKTDFRDFVRDLYSQIEPYTHDLVDAKHPSIVDTINFDDPDGIEELMGRSIDEISADGVLKTGYQAINRMLGESEGFRRGEFVLLGALQHNFKTGFMMNMFKHLALYNKPYMRDPTKKPLIIQMSLENELPMNIMWLYTNLKENETGVTPDPAEVNIKEAAAYIKLRMEANGYHIEMLRLEPNQTSYFDVLDILLQYEAEGYEIHAVVCDYLNMVNRNGLPAGPAGTEIRALFRIMRNFCAPRGITFLTPHQLSTEAKMLVRQGVDNFVQEIANKGYYDGSKQIDQEVDLELFVHIEKVKGVGSFLAIQRGKHRKISITNEADLYTVLPFHPVGGVLDDVNGEDLSMKSVGGKATADGGGDWFDG